MSKQKNHVFINFFIKLAVILLKEPIKTIRFIFSGFVCFLISFSSLSYAKQSKVLSIMTFNIENGGTQVDFNKIVEAVRKSGADVVGLQEAWGNIKRLADALNWKYYDPAMHVVSRFPLKSTAAADHLYLLVELSRDRYVAIVNMHLPDEPYGPTMAGNGASVQAIIANEYKIRVPTASPYLQSAAKLAGAGIPVFVTGDFNSPSHLDWTEAVAKVNHRYRSIPWVVTQLAEQSGLRDSFRVAHPNPLSRPAYTWPAKRPFINNAVDEFNPNENDLPVRIDFILAAGPARVLNSKIIGEIGNQGVDIAIQPWPSDHRAVVSTFKVEPAALPAKLDDVHLVYPHDKGKSLIRTSKPVVKSGEAIEINWFDAPGSRYDYIRIAPRDANKSVWCETVRLYIDASASGQMIYHANNVRGNRLQWCQAEKAVWPLLPGRYDVDLMLDDSHTVLASTHVRVLASAQ